MSVEMKSLGAAMTSAGRSRRPVMTSALDFQGIAAALAPGTRAWKCGAPMRWENRLGSVKDQVRLIRQG